MHNMTNNVGRFSNVHGRHALLPNGAACSVNKSQEQGPFRHILQPCWHGLHALHISKASYSEKVWRLCLRCAINRIRKALIRPPGSIASLNPLEGRDSHCILWVMQRVTHHATGTSVWSPAKWRTKDAQASYANKQRSQVRKEYSPS